MHSQPYSQHSHSYSPHSRPPLISRIPTPFPAFPLFPPDPRNSQPDSLYSHPDSSHFHLDSLDPTLIPRIPIIHLIPLSDSLFRLLQIA